MLTIIMGISKEAQTAALRVGVKAPAVVDIVVGDPVPAELAAEALDLGAQVRDSGDLTITHATKRHEDGRYVRSCGEGLAVIPDGAAGALAAIRAARAATARQEADEQAKKQIAARAEATRRILEASGKSAEWDHYHDRWVAPTAWPVGIGDPSDQIADILTAWADAVEQANATTYTAWSMWIARPSPRGEEPRAGLLRPLAREIRAARQEEREYADQQRRAALLDWARVNLPVQPRRIDDGSIPSAEIVEAIESHLLHLLAPLGEDHDGGYHDEKPLARYSAATWSTLQRARQALITICGDRLTGSAEAWRVTYTTDDTDTEVEEVCVTLRHVSTGVEVEVWLRSEQ